MANKKIQEFAVLESAADDDLLLISSDSETYSIKVSSLKAFLQKSNMSAATITLYQSAWEENLQTAACAGVSAASATCHVIISPAPDDAQDYGKYGIVCYEQGAGSLSFRAETTPLKDLEVNVLILS